MLSHSFSYTGKVLNDLMKRIVIKYVHVCVSANDLTCLFVR